MIKTLPGGEVGQGKEKKIKLLFLHNNHHQTTKDQPFIGNVTFASKQVDGMKTIDIDRTMRGGGN